MLKETIEQQRSKIASLQTSLSSSNMASQVLIQT
jgi:hypothetical protein